MKSYIDSFINLIYPKSCCGCGNSLLRNEWFLCASCEIDFPLNPEIGLPQNEIMTVFDGRLPLQTANTFLYFTKKGIAQNLIHQLKYQDREDLGIFLGKRFAHLLTPAFSTPPDLIIPMPLHPKKEKQRGYNQCNSIAKGLGEVLEIPIATDLVERVVANPSQTKLNRAKRWDNVKGIFKVHDYSSLKNKHVLLIDDTLTTGATLESCGQELVKNSNVKLSIAALAYAK